MLKLFASSVTETQDTAAALRPLHPELIAGTMDVLKSGLHDTNAQIATTLAHDALKAGASDVHLDPTENGCVVRFRINGVLYDTQVFLEGGAQRLINQIKTAAEIDPLPAFKAQEGRWHLQHEDRYLDLRVTTIPAAGGEKMAIRLLDPQKAGQQLDSIGLAGDHYQKIQRWSENADGLFLTVGPTGSGKTTTLYALLQRFRETARSVITVEDPVEFRLDGVSQIQVNERHDLTFANALRSTLRLDPDVVMVGEVRDDESASAAVDAAITGRVVMSSLHCRDAASAVTALRNWGVTNHQIAASLRIVVAQRLVRRLNPDASLEVALTDSDLHWLRVVGAEAPSVCFEPDASADPHALRGAGRTGVYEVLELNENDVDLILANASERELRRALHARGHATLVADGLAKVEAGLISLADLRQAIGVPRNGLNGAAASRTEDRRDDDRRASGRREKDAA